jgi:hypothetical protein
LWQKTTTTYTKADPEISIVMIGTYGDKGDQGEKGDKGDQGEKGETGSTGVGIASITNYYARSTSSTTVPTEWEEEVPTITSYYKYLWNYEVVTYTDTTTSETAKRIIGAYGETGAQGAAGATITTITEYYMASASKTGITIYTDGWKKEPQQISSDKPYLWNYEEVNFSNGRLSDTDPVIIGVYGDTGETGNGIDTITVTWGRSTDQDTEPTVWQGNRPTLTSVYKYLWQKTVTTYTKSDPVTVIVMIGTYGDKGDTGEKGDTGAAGNGVKYSSTTWMVTATNEKPSSSSAAWSFDCPTLTPEYKYLWRYDYTEYTDGTITQVVGAAGVYGDTGADGAKGNGIESITNFYARSTSNTTAPTTWQEETVPTMTSTYRYLWNYEAIGYDNGDKYETTKRVIGVYGSTGSSGKGISSITEYYLATNTKSGVTTDTSGWSTTPPEITAQTPYLWNYEVISYTSGSPTSSIPAIIGVYGESVLDWKDYWLTTTTYAQPAEDDSNWSEERPAPTSTDKYLWKKTIENLSGEAGGSRTTITLEAVYGDTGNGIASITAYFAVNGTSVSAPADGRYSTTRQTLSSTSKYLWSKYLITYDNGDTAWTTPCVIGTYGDTGARGATGNGIEKVVDWYYLSTSGTECTGGTWTTTPPDFDESDNCNKYCWTKEIITYTDSTTQETTAILDQGWETRKDYKLHFASTADGFEIFNTAESGDLLLTNKGIIIRNDAYENIAYVLEDQLYIDKAKIGTRAFFGEDWVVENRGENLDFFRLFITEDES